MMHYNNAARSVMAALIAILAVVCSPPSALAETCTPQLLSVELMSGYSISWIITRVTAEQEAAIALLSTEPERESPLSRRNKRLQTMSAMQTEANDPSLSHSSVSRRNV